MVNFLTATLACAHAGQPALSVACGVSDHDLRPVQLVGGDRIFVEPQALAVAGGRLLVAGKPTYLWHVSDTSVTLVKRDTAFGIIVDSTASAFVVPTPIPANRVQSVRAAPYGRNEWAVVFAEAEPKRRFQDDPQVVAYWFGVTDGLRWRRLDKLPDVSGDLRTDEASPLVAANGAYAIAVPIHVHNADNVVVFISDGTGWTTTVLRTGIVSYVALAGDSTGWMVGVVYPDPTVASDENSFWTYRTGRDARFWQEPSLLIRGRSEAVHHPALAVVDGSIAVSWLAERDGGYEARVGVSQDGRKLDAVLPLFHPSEQLVVDTRATGHPVWVTADRRGERPNVSTVHLWMMSSGTLLQLTEVANPFEGTFGSASLGSSVLLVGPVRGATTREPAVSLSLLRLTLTCS